MTKDQQEHIADVPEVGWVIRITDPPTIAHTSETHLYPNLALARDAANGIGGKLCGLGVEEFNIIIINQSTGVMEHTLTRRVEKKVLYEAH